MADHLSIDVFWSFRSPYSYLAAPRLRQWQDRYALAVNLRPVYPLAIRTPEFFQQQHPQWVSYLLTDVVRLAEYLGLPLAWPDPDPVNQYVDADGVRRTGEEQPYIHRLTRLGALAAEEGDGMAFAEEVSRLIWGGTTHWHEGDHLAAAAERAGFDFGELEARADSEADRLEAVIAENQAAHEAAGHWGVPTCVFRGEPFFGQDRLDLLLWRLRQAGLEERPPAPGSGQFS